MIFWNFSASTDAKDMMHFAGTLLQLTSKVLIAHDSVSDPQCAAGPWVQLMVSRNELNECHLNILTDSTCPFQGYLLLLYIIPITSISEYLTFSAISMHFNNPTVNSQALPEELLDDPPGYRLKKLIKKLFPGRNSFRFISMVEFLWSLGS